MESLQDRVVVITGASAGIGRATAHELIGAGARVVLGARRKERLDEMRPFMGGGDMIREVHKDEVTWAAPPMKFEAGGGGSATINPREALFHAAGVRRSASDHHGTAEANLPPHLGGWGICVRFGRRDHLVHRSFEWSR